MYYIAIGIFIAIVITIAIVIIIAIGILLSIYRELLKHIISQYVTLTMCTDDYGYPYDCTTSMAILVYIEYI